MMSMQINGSKILITGAAKRIGRVIALSLAEQGAKLVIHYNKSAEEARQLGHELKALGADYLFLQADLKKIKSLEKLALQAWAAFDGLDVLINNASNYYPSPLGQSKEEEWDDLMQINAKAPYFLAQSIGIKMKKRKKGKIINIADWAGQRPYEDYAPYCASKAALIALSQSIAKSLAPQVSVNCILPGPIMWPEDLGQKIKKSVLEKTPLRRSGHPSDIAKTVEFLIEGSDFMTGALINVDGGRGIV